MCLSGPEGAMKKYELQFVGFLVRSIFIFNFTLFFYFLLFFLMQINLLFYSPFQEKKRLKISVRVGFGWFLAWTKE